MKNRTIIGIICMALAVVMTFVVAPIVTNITSDTTKIVRLTQDVKQGSPITEDVVEVVKVDKDSIPSGAIEDKADVVGKYAASNLYTGDFFTKAKLTNNGNTAEDVFATLDGKHVAISVTVDSLAAGVSGKLQNGDIVTFLIVNNDTNKAVTPPELKYMKVITTTTSGGIDKDAVIKNEDGSYELPSTITVLANTQQAKLLAEYEGNAEIHAALVYRGDKSTAEKFLSTQNSYFKNKTETTTEGGAVNE